MPRKFSKHVAWTEGEKKILLVMYPAECSIADIVAALPGRTKSKIQGKASSLGLKRPVIPKISDAERLKRKRESMARSRAENPEKAKNYRNDYHRDNRDKQCLKMREYSRKRFFWSRAIKLRSNKRATYKEIASLWKRQRGRCALTGRKLDRTAQLDHILPKSRGGGDSVGNLQWLCEEANIAKRHMTDSEFICLCSSVMKWLGERIKMVDNI